MKRLPHLAILLGILGSALTKAEDKSAPTPTIYSCSTEREINALPQSQVTVTERSPCSVQLTTTDGKDIYLGGPGSSAKVIRAFMATLKDGRVYQLPDDFLAFQKSWK